MILTKYLPTNLFSNHRVSDNNFITNPIVLSNQDLDRLKSYNISHYISDITTLGIEKTWDIICQFILDSNYSDFLNIEDFGELYEIGLAIQNKQSKKKSGQYYTPKDVAQVMVKWFYKCEGINVCDVACGTGNLILTYLELLGYDEARKLISCGNLYLYDFDKVALKICRTIIAVKYGVDIIDKVHVSYCDFLDRDVCLPDNCKVISNPPYSKIDCFNDSWEETGILLDTKELYSSFMEKIIKQSKSSVIITPFSFLNGNKFYSLRKLMCDRSGGFIVSFDNVPGNIFNGRKQGIFNTNVSNSVRAAISVINDKERGYKISPLIRFKNEEREFLLNNSLLENTLPEDYQIVDNNKTQFAKVDKELSNLFNTWVKESKFTVEDILSDRETPYLIEMPNTCRYFTTASSRHLSRTGAIKLYLKTERDFNFLYCFINSSFAYWWWRIYDGGITYPQGLLNSMPLPINLCSEEDNSFFNKMTKLLSSKENDFIITKKNAGVLQENIKFPVEYRDRINERFLKILGVDLDIRKFDKIHSNCFFFIKVLT